MRTLLAVSFLLLSAPAGAQPTVNACKLCGCTCGCCPGGHVAPGALQLTPVGKHPRPGKCLVVPNR